MAFGLNGVSSSERDAPKTHRVKLEDEAAELPEVNRQSVGLVQDHLGRQVRPRPADRRRAEGSCPRSQDLAEAHVGEAKVALRIHENVFRLQKEERTGIPQPLRSGRDVSGQKHLCPANSSSSSSLAQQ